MLGFIYIYVLMDVVLLDDVKCAFLIVGYVIDCITNFTLEM